MPSSPVFKIIKRVQQACENCRRKKTRCPGQRPACSSCTRLSQQCIYGGGQSPSGASRASGSGQALETRLAQLEEAMRVMVSRVGPQEGHPAFNLISTNTRTETPSEPDDTPGLTPSESGVRPEGFLHESLLPPSDCLFEMPQLYRRHCHRQPLWLFDDTELASLPQQSEELVFSLLALTTRFSGNPYFERDRHELSQRFCDAARTRVMLRIANATVKFSTIQSLCLLSYTNFAAKDTSLASLCLNLARDLLKSAGLDLRRSDTQAGPADQASKRLFWSLYSLEQHYGAHSNRTISMKGGLENLRYCVSVGDHARRPLALEPPLVPEEVSHHGDSKDLGIWNYTVCLSAYWNEVRNYILLCASDTERAPWAPESYYTLIVSYMHELETQLPQPHRWDYKRFLQWSTEALERDRSYWGPWLSFQFTYHAIYTVINHPFLLTSRTQPSKLKMPNTFWRASSETVLLHSTWIIRLITMTRDKQFDVYDPFLGYVAGVAASAQLFYCRSQNDELRRSARENLEKCKAFIDHQAQVWPWCDRIKQNLDTLIDHAFGNNSAYQPSQTICIDTTAMLEILDYSRPHAETRTGGAGLGSSGTSLFDQSLLQLRDDRTGDQVATIELSEDVSEAAGRPVAPPIWRPAAATTTTTTTTITTSSERDCDRGRDQPQQTQPDLSLPTPSDAPTNTTPVEPLHGTEVFSLPADNFTDGMLQDIFHHDLQWWDVGN